jgi:hypothetical protein
MSVPARLGAFALVLAATFGGGAALGAAFGPDDLAPPPSHDQPHTELTPTSTGMATSPTAGDHRGSHP